MDEQARVLKDGVWAALERRNIPRHSFLRFCSILTFRLNHIEIATKPLQKGIEPHKLPCDMKPLPRSI